GIMHVCFQVDQKTEAYSRFLTGGATPMGARDLQQLNPRNPVYYGYARDQDGLIVEFEEVDVAALKLPAPPKNRYRIRQVALATPDVVRLSDFYALLLEQPEFRRTGDWFFTRMRGETFDKVVGLTELSGEAAWFQIRNLELEIFQFHSHPTKPLSTPRPIDAFGYNMIVFDVADLDAARELLLKAGGTLATDVQDMDGGEMLFGRDPDGNLLGFQSAPTDAVVSSQNFKNNGIE
ncbi:MAG: VOC family protein, partial [Pseudomonadota bacterium]